MDDHRDRVLKLDMAWVEGHRNWEPSTEDRMPNFLRESIRDWDADPEERQSTSDLKIDRQPAGARILEPVGASASQRPTQHHFPACLSNRWGPAKSPNLRLVGKFEFKSLS